MGERRVKNEGNERATEVGRNGACGVEKRGRKRGKKEGKEERKGIKQRQRKQNKGGYAGGIV